MTEQIEQPEEQNSQPEMYTPPSRSKPNTKTLIALGLIVLFALFVYKNNTSLNIPNPFTQPVVSPPPSETALITISNKGFAPQTLLIKKGTRVTWTNNDTRPHQIMTDPHPLHSLLPKLKGENPINKGFSYSFVFNTKGTFTYHDEINPLKLKGTIIVE